MTVTEELLKARQEAHGVIEPPENAEYVGYYVIGGVRHYFYKCENEYYSTNDRTLEFDRQMKEAQKRNARIRRHKK